MYMIVWTLGFIRATKMSMCGVFILCRGPGWKKSMQFFPSLHFERIYLKKDYYYGTPQEIYDKLRVELNAVDKKLQNIRARLLNC